MLTLDRDADSWRLEEVWRSERLRRSFSPTVFRDDALYGFDGPNLTCLDAATGSLRWQSNLGDGSLILVDDSLVVLGSSSGRVTVVAASTEGFRERASIAVFERGGYGPPSFAAERLFVRGASGLAAIEITDGRTKAIR